MNTSLLRLETFLIPSLVNDHFLNEVLGILDIVLQECSSSCSIKVTTGHTSQAMVETLDKEPFLYPMMRIDANVLLETFPCFGNCLVCLLLEARNLSTKGAGFAHQKEFL